MSILRYATPEARYYQYDRDIMKDYDNRINLYNTALDKYKTEAGSYQTLVDAHNAKVNQYNTDLENWRNNANAYNEAIAAWNETDRTTPYEEWANSVASPGEWVGTAPVFEGGSAPVAPADPGFSGEDVDAFVEEAQARATRRGDAAATAQAVMTSPGQYYTVGRDTFGSTPEVSLAGMSGFGSTAMGFEDGGNPVAEMTQQELLDSGTLPFHDIVRNFAVNPDNYYDDARTEWDRGNYGASAGDYLVGLTGELPWSSSMAGLLADFLEWQEKTQEPAVRNYEEGGVAGLFRNYAQGGAVTAITDEDLTAMRQKVINDYGFDPIDIAMEEGVDPELYLRVMYTENKGRQGPVSEAGAIGLMQLMPGTARELGVDPNDPIQNARGGARYLRQQLNTFQTVPLALAAYNAGPGNVQKYGGVPPFEETRNYVAMIHGVDTGEILPDMNAFYTRVEGEDPSPKPRMRPEGLGTPGYTPPTPVQSEYLMSGLGSVFGGTRPAEQPAQTRQMIPNIMQQAPQTEEEARGIEFYRQYAAYGEPQEDQRNQSLASSPST
jgi:hypothetical protein